MWKLWKYSMWMPGLTFVFDKDDGDEGGDDKGGGAGKDEDSGKKDGDKDEGKKDETGTTYDLKVKGEMRTFTLDELKTAAQKVTGIEAVAEEAAENRKKAEKGLRIQDLAQELRESDSPKPEVQREFMQALGLPTDAIDKLVAQATGEGKKDSKDPDKGQDLDKKVVPISMDQLDPRLRQVVEAAEQDDLRRIREGIDKACEEGVDNDKILGKMLGEVDADRRDALQDFLHRSLKKDVKSRILAREEYGTEMIASSLQTVRADVKALGIPATVGGQPPVEGIDYANALGANIHATEPITRKTITDPEYHDVAASRLQQMIYAATRKGRTDR